MKFKHTFSQDRCLGFRKRAGEVYNSTGQPCASSKLMSFRFDDSFSEILTYPLAHNKNNFNTYPYQIPVSSSSSASSSSSCRQSYKHSTDLPPARRRTSDVFCSQMDGRVANVACGWNGWLIIG